MTLRLGPLAGPALALVAAALFLGLLSGRPELFLATVPLLGQLLLGAFETTAPRFRLTHDVSRTRLFEDEELVVTITVVAESRLSLLELLESLPPSVELVAGSNHAVLALEPGERRRWTYTVRCVSRGRFALGTVHARSWSRSGLRAVETRHAAPTPIHVFPRAIPIRHVPHPLRTQTSVGNYVAPTLGEGLEPGDTRLFAPGDRIRRVNWRASLRLGKLYVTQYHEERNADVVLLLDTLSHAGLAPETTLDHAVRAAASLARAYLARKDRVGMIEYGGVFRWVRPGSGPAQLERLLEALVAAQPVFSYVRKDVALIPPRILPSQALVIALSPLLDPRILETLQDLAARGFDLVTLAISPIALVRAALRPSPHTDLACRVWAIERQRRHADLRRRGLVVLDWAPSEPLELALVPLGRRRRRRTALVG